jgi:hypothetical protein
VSLAGLARHEVVSLILLFAILQETQQIKNVLEHACLVRCILVPKIPNTHSYIIDWISCHGLWSINIKLALHSLCPSFCPLYMKSLWSLFIHFYSLVNFYHHQIVVSITVCCPRWSDIMYTQMPSPVCQNMFNLIVGFPIWRCQSIFMDVGILSLRSFSQRICPSMRLFQNFCNLIFHEKRLFVPRPSWRTTPYRLSTSAYSLYSQLPYIAGGHFLQPQPEDAPCCGDKWVTCLTWNNYTIKVKISFKQLVCW